MNARGVAAGIVPDTRSITGLVTVGGRMVILMGIDELMTAPHIGLVERAMSCSTAMETAR
jgi:hypothetical protein